MVTVSAVIGPHANVNVHLSSRPKTSCVIAVHGRGGTAADIMRWAQAVVPEASVLAPQAVGQSWYPQRFLVPQVENQPHLSSALTVLRAVLMKLEADGVPNKSIHWVGFSQGACLVAEYIKQYPCRYGSVTLMSGGLIGTDAEVESAVVGSLHNTPIYLGCDVDDPHIPNDRLLKTGDVLERLQGDVATEQYQAWGHRPHPQAEGFLRDRYMGSR